MIDRIDLSDARDLLRRVGPTDEHDGESDARSADESDPDDRRPAGGDPTIRTDGDPGGWEAVESPTSRTLHGVVHGQDGPYACGEGGLLLHRTTDGWRVLLERGPGVSKNTLRSIAATDDGCRLWFAGDSGALGFYDVADGHLSDYSAPMEKTSTWESIAVSGKTGEERVRIANGSGEVLDCRFVDGCPVWGAVVKPGGGSTIRGIAGGSDGFYAVDTSGGAYYEPGNGDSSTDDSTTRELTPTGSSTREPTSPEPANGESSDSAPESADVDPKNGEPADSAPRDGEPADTEPSERNPSGDWVRIGVRNAEVNFQDIWAGDESVYVAGADGIAYRYNPTCENWTPLYVGQGTLQSIRSVGTDTVAVATGGRIYERDKSVRWTQLETPTEQSLLDLALARTRNDVGGLATVSVDVAVGAGGVILERDRRDRSSRSDGRD